MTIVVLHERDGILDVRSRDEDRSDPVMQERIRNGLTSIDVEMIHDNLATTEPLQHIGPASDSSVSGPEKRFRSRGLPGNAMLRHCDVLVEHRVGLRTELRGIRRRGEQHERHDDEHPRERHYAFHHKERRERLTIGLAREPAIERVRAQVSAVSFQRLFTESTARTTCPSPQPDTRQAPSPLPMPEPSARQRQPPTLAHAQAQSPTASGPNPCPPKPKARQRKSPTHPPFHLRAQQRQRNGAVLEQAIVKNAEVEARTQPLGGLGPRRSISSRPSMYAVA